MIHPEPGKEYLVRTYVGGPELRMSCINISQFKDRNNITFDLTDVVGWEELPKAEVISIDPIVDKLKGLERVLISSRDYTYSETGQLELYVKWSDIEKIING